MLARNTSKSELGRVIGDAKAARESVRRIADAGVDELILIMQTGTVPHELVMQSLRTFAADVMPYFS